VKIQITAPGRLHAPSPRAVYPPEILTLSQPLARELLDAGCAVPLWSTTTAITGAANNGAGLVRITAAGHPFLDGDRTQIYGVLGCSEANGSAANSWTWPIAFVDASHFDLVGSVFVNPYTSGGTALGA
jgi:hypothetical protein